MSKKVKAEEYAILKKPAYMKIYIADGDCIETINIKGKDYKMKEIENIENRIDEIFENHNIKSFTELNERLCDYNELKFANDIYKKQTEILIIIRELFTFDEKQFCPFKYKSLINLDKNKDKLKLLKEYFQWEKNWKR